ncbi:hypothetical protein AVEN_53411-1 [Araneus ventricosus]|uniref:Uncharacterized protein n=1 Tax=Araneus ventricosus TaxID=182803 RepID=A0A4Y2AAL1_ARAVE|nr:hypothetical protein AVEN_53411-1 [Araneus ventricosus]
MRSCRICKRVITSLEMYRNNAAVLATSPMTGCIFFGRNWCIVHLLYSISLKASSRRSRYTFPRHLPEISLSQPVLSGEALPGRWANILHWQHIDCELPAPSSPQGCYYGIRGKAAPLARSWGLLAIGRSNSALHSKHRKG